MSALSEIAALPLIAPEPPTRRNRVLARRSRGSGKLSDRRATPRVAVELECEERLGRSRYVRLTTDLSPFGLSTRQGYSHPLGTKLHLALFLPDDPSHPVRLRGEVVGLFPDNAGIRIAFRHPSQEAVRRINKYLKSRYSRR